MKDKETVLAEIEVLNTQYRSGNLSRVEYLKRHKKITNQLKPLSFAERIRKEGIKVSRSKTHYGDYTYKGKNFTVNFCEASCENTWWEVSLWDDNVDQRVFEQYNDYNQWDTKSEVVDSLYHFDMSLNK